MKIKKNFFTHLTPFVLSYTNYWKCWFKWRFLLVVVCHFVISFHHLFGIFKLLLHIKRKDLLAQSLVTFVRFNYPDLVFLIPRISIIWLTIFWLWVYIMKIIAETPRCCVFLCDCWFCWYWSNCFNCLFIITSHLNYWIQKQSLNIHIHVL